MVSYFFRNNHFFKAILFYNNTINIDDKLELETLDIIDIENALNIKNQTKYKNYKDMFYDYENMKTELDISNSISINNLLK